ncbi:hypothetical protein DFS33DRAFT_139768 [Desarmillaria ectypa]|nr:hypothetical protein DFS33DRAFT_139768 [Desarmillaria ectypa]
MLCAFLRLGTAAALATTRQIYPGPIKNVRFSPGTVLILKATTARQSNLILFEALHPKTVKWPRPCHLIWRRT